MNGSDVGGSDFFSTSIVLVDGVPIVPVFLSDTLLRVTIPSSCCNRRKSSIFRCDAADGDTSTPAALNVRPGAPGCDFILARQRGAGPEFERQRKLTGGFFFHAPSGKHYRDFQWPE